MIDRNDWQAVHDAMIADDRAKLGAPPTVNELLAYERGELSKEDADRVQQLLIAYPELARAYATPFPSDDANLPEDVIDRQWQAFRRTVHPPGRVLPFWRASAAIAAMLAVVLGAMLWQTRKDMLQPHIVLEPHILTPDGVRGLGSEPNYTLTPVGGPLLVVVSLIGSSDYDMYRLELVDADSHRRIWSSEPLRAPASSSFDVEIPSRALAPGTYRIIAWGLRGSAQERVATYTIEVRQRPH
jgi:hypothetical protein